jgi:serine/threonine protein kinase
VSQDQNIVNRFEREVMIMERLNHPHIVQHLGGGIMDGQYFYAMQLLDHGTLKDRLMHHGPLPWPQAAAYAAQIASALQHAHNHGIIHRDLKPSNLFFAADGRLLLGDFGIARDTRAADITDHGVTVGTFSYMSPEQIRADPNISGKADLYSLGCVLYEMLTGRPPFVGGSSVQVWEQHLHNEPRGIREQFIDCPEWLEELTLRLLAKDPAQRPFNARSVQGLLRERLIDEFGESATELTKNLPSVPAVTAHSHAPRVWVLWLVLACVALLIFGVALTK